MSKVQWTGKNTRDIKRFLGDPGGIARFIPRRSPNMNETLWKNIAEDDWGPEVSAALYDESEGAYTPVVNGQWIECL